MAHPYTELLERTVASATKLMHLVGILLCCHQCTASDKEARCTTSTNAKSEWRRGTQASASRARLPLPPSKEPKVGDALGEAQEAPMSNTSRKTWIATQTASAEDTNLEAEILEHQQEVALPGDSSLPAQAVAQGAKGLTRDPAAADCPGSATKPTFEPAQGTCGSGCMNRYYTDHSHKAENAGLCMSLDVCIGEYCWS